FLDGTALHHLVGVLHHARLVVETLHRVGACLELGFGKAEMESTRTLERHVEPGLFLQGLREAGPAIRGTPRPGGVFRHAEPFALDPDQREIAARGAVGDIALVEHGDATARAREAPADCRADQPAADDGHIILASLAHALSASLLSPGLARRGAAQDRRAGRAAASRRW